MLLVCAFGALAAPTYDHVDLTLWTGGDTDPRFLDDDGHVVGVASFKGQQRAFWWDPDHGLTRVTLHGWSSPRAMNEVGQVVGQSVSPDGEAHAFLFDHGMNQIFDLGTLGSGWSAAIDVNDAGQVVGNSGNERGQSRAFWWDVRRRVMMDTGTLGGEWSRAVAVLETGELLGVSETPDGEAHPFLWDPATGRTTDLGTLGGRRAEPVAANREGQVVGWSELPDGTIRPWFWDGALHDLGGLGGTDARAVAINDAGQVIGWSITRTGAERGWTWNAVTDTFADLGTLGGADVGPAALNERGVVVGWSTTRSGGVHAWRWDPDDARLRDLHPVSGTDSRPVDVGEAGHVIGVWTRAGVQRGFVWTPDGVADLGLPGTTAGLVRAVNVRGEVVGWNDLGDGIRHGYVARPGGLDGDQDGVVDALDLCPVERAEWPDLLEDGCPDRTCDLSGWLLGLPPEDLAMPWGIHLVSLAESACDAAKRGRADEEARQLQALLRAAEAGKGRHVAEEIVHLLMRFVPGNSGV